MTISFRSIAQCKVRFAVMDCPLCDVDDPMLFDDMLSANNYARTYGGYVAMVTA